MRNFLASALLLASAASCAPARANDLPFVRDKYADALSEARQRKLPLFVEVWAPW